MEETSAAVKAPASSWPSMAMFTTPARSDSTPDMEPNTRGVVMSMAPVNRPTRVMFCVVVPPMIHTMTPITNTTVKVMMTHLAILPVALVWL